MRKFTSPSVVAAPSPVLSARLVFQTSSHHNHTCETIELIVENDVPQVGQATLTAPDGVFPACHTPMRLKLEDECGCWETIVNVETRPQPVVSPGVYSGTGGVEEIIPTAICTPPAQE